MWAGPAEAVWTATIQDMRLRAEEKWKRVHILMVVFLPRLGETVSEGGWEGGKGEGGSRGKERGWEGREDGEGGREGRKEGRKGGRRREGKRGKMGER